MPRELSEKGAAIREMLAKHPEMGNKDVAEAVTKAGKVGEVKPTDVAQQKQALKKGSGQSAVIPTGHLGKPQTSRQFEKEMDAKIAERDAQVLGVLDHAEAVQKAIKALGVSAVRAIIDRYGKQAMEGFGG